MTDPRRFAASPAAAYRADMADRTTPFGPDDDLWLAAAGSLHLAASTGGTARRQHLYECIGIANDLLGEDRIQAYIQREWQGERSVSESPMVLADEVHEAGALHLAAIMLDDLRLAIDDLSVVEQGRILALRARIERKLGRLEDAVERYEHLTVLGTQSGSAELQSRAEVGLAAIAQVRGNLPKLRAHSMRAAELARQHGYREQARLAYQGLTIVAGKTKAYEDGLLAGWEVVQLSLGDAAREAEALQNLGQVMLDAGQFSLARASFAAVMSRRAPPGLLLNALGGLALASAHLGNEATVEWSVKEVWRALGSPVPRYELADALLESALALGLLQRTGEAARFGGAANKIAVTEGFHELAFRAQHLEGAFLDQRVPAQTFGASAAAVAQEVLALEPEQLPSHVDFEAAPA